MVAQDAKKAGDFTAAEQNLELALTVIQNDPTGINWGSMPDSVEGELADEAPLRAEYELILYAARDERLALSFSGSPWRARKGMMPWYEAPEPAWEGTRIVFGHWSQLGLIVLPGLVSLDTGCVWGRQLTAVRLDTKVPRVYQVPGQR